MSVDAPELLEALRGMLEAFGYRGHSLDRTSEEVAALNEARAALAKAVQS